MLPSDPIMLLSFVNMKLRDNYASLDALCEDMDADKEEILRKLKGKKYLIAGNHDISWLTKFDASRYFEDITKFLETSDGQHRLVLSHRPQVSWDHERRAYMVHGHIHNDTSADFWPLLCVRERALNAGVDINGFRPVTFEELLANNIAFKKASIQNLSEGQKLLFDYIGQRQNE